MDQRRILHIDDFISSTIKAFKFMGWNPFSDHDFKSSRCTYYLRHLYMFVTNFYIVLGLVLETIYCFAVAGEPGGFLKITNTTPIIGEACERL